MTDRIDAALARDRADRRERKRRQAREGFRWHLRAFIGVNVLLVAIWVATAVGAESTPHLWFIYPLFGWGLGLAGHYYGVRAAYPAPEDEVTGSDRSRDAGPAV